MLLKIFKVGLLTLVLSLLFWLIIDINQKRLNELRSAIKNDCLIDLTSENTEKLNKLISTLLSAVNIKKEFDINSDPDVKIINFYITRPEFHKETKCQKGNAIYDSVLDAIIIDESLCEELFENNDGRFLSFLILHELGHRKLHKKSSAFFDSKEIGHDNKSQKYEIEADEFSIINLYSAYEVDLALGKSQLSMFNDLFGKDEAFYFNFLRMLSSKSRELLIEDFPYSTFYSDASHPTLVQRFKNVLNVLNEKEFINETGKTYIDILEKEIGRLEIVMKNKIIELSFSKVISNLSMGKDHSIFYSYTDGDIYKVPNHLLTGSNFIVEDYIMASFPYLEEVFFGAIEKIWELKDGTILIVDEKGTLYYCKDSNWKKDTSLLEVADNSSFIEVFNHSMPSDRIALIFENKIVLIFSSNKKRIITNEWALESISNNQEKSYQIESLQFINIINDCVYYALMSDLHLKKVIEYSLSTEEISEYDVEDKQIYVEMVPGIKGIQIFNRKNEKFIIDYEYVHKIDNNPRKWCLKKYYLDSENEQHLGCFSFLDDGVPTSVYDAELNIMYSGEGLEEIKPLIDDNKELLLLDFMIPGAIYIFNLKDYSLNPIFQPGGGEILDSEGWFTFLPYGRSNKLYRIKK